MRIKTVRKRKSTLLNDTDTVLNSTAIITKRALFCAVFLVLIFLQDLISTPNIHCCHTSTSDIF